MMPLTFADIEEDNIIKRIGGTPEVKKHLENLGFVVGGNVKVVNRMGYFYSINGICSIEINRTVYLDYTIRAYCYKISSFVF